MSEGAWSTGLLVDFLSVVSAVPEAGIAKREAVERGAETLEADFGALVEDGRVTASVGFQPQDVTAQELVAAAHARAEMIELTALGSARVAAIPLDDVPEGWLLFGRLSGRAFDQREARLVGGWRACSH